MRASLRLGAVWHRLGLAPVERTAVIAAVLGITLSAAAWLGTRAFIDRPFEEAALAAVGNSHRHTFEGNLADVGSALAAVGAYVQASGADIAHAEFQTFLDTIADPALGVGQFAWVPRVTGDRREAFEAAAAESGARNYRIVRRGAGGEWVAAPRQAEHYPVLYLSGPRSMPLVPGLDVASRSDFRELLVQALDSGGSTVFSPVLRSVDGPGGESIVVAVRPIYRSAVPPKRREDREHALRGFVVGVLWPIVAISQTLLDHSDIGAVDLYFFDASAGTDDRPFHVAGSPRRTSPAEPVPMDQLLRGTHWQGRIALGSQAWTMVAVPYGHAFGFTTNYDAIVLGAGLFLTFLLALYAQVSGDQRRLTHAALKRVKAHAEVVGRVGQAQELISGDVEALARRITELAAQATGCERVNVWLYNEAETELVCIDLYEATPKRHSAGMVLPESAFGPELATVKASKFVAADDPLIDPRTAGYVEPYIKPLGITSMLDTAIQASGVTLGLLCFEHVGPAHRWETDEIEFAAQLADKIGLALFARRRHEAEAALRDSELRFKAVFDHARDGIALLDAETRTSVIANKRLCEMFGYTPQEFLTLGPKDVHPADALPGIMDEIERQMRGESHVLLDVPNLRKDGSIFFADINATPVVIAGKRYLLGIFHDVSERRAVEEAVRRSEEKYRNLVESTSDYIWEIDENARYTYVSPAVKALLGYEPRELEGRSPYDVMPPGEAERTAAVFNPIIEARQPFSMIENAAARKDGRVITLESSGIPIFDKDGTFRGYRGIDRDITARKEAEKALRESQEFIRTILDALTVRVFWKGRDLRFLGCNAAFARDAGLSAPADLIGKDDYQMGWRDQADLYRADDMRVIESGHSKLLIEEQQTTPDGRTITLLTSKVPLRNAAGDIIGVLGTYMDITDRKRAEEALRASEARYIDLFQSTRDAIMLLDPVQGRFSRANPSALRMFGVSEEETFRTIGPLELSPERQPDGRLSAEKAREMIDMAMRNGSHLFEWTHKRADGTEFPADVLLTRVSHGEGNMLYGIVRDITERKLAERALQRRDALLHAVTVGASQLLTAEDLDQAIGTVLELVGRTLDVDRLLVLERPLRKNSPPVLRHLWEGVRAPSKVTGALFEDPGLRNADFAAWIASAEAGATVVTETEKAPDDVRRLFERLGVKRNLIIPIMVDGRYWGQLAVDSSDAGRVWADFETDILQTLAELLGTTIQRDRYMKELSDANRIVQNSPTILYRLRAEPSLPMTYVSENVKEVLGYEQAHMLADPYLYQAAVHPDDLEKVRESWTKILGDQRIAVIDFRLVTPSGDVRWVENHYGFIRDRTGRAVEVEGLLVDITERKAAEEKIAHLARTDPLTGLPNRATFIERLQQAFAAARRGAQPFAVMYVDLDRFKEINDTYGHPAGDTLLITVAERLGGAVRETDVVGRLGGDEFGVLQAEVGSTSDAGMLAEKIRKALAEPIVAEGHELHTAVSLGICVYAPDIADAGEMLAQADAALYRAKEEGRNQYRFHTEELDARVREEFRIAEELSRAIDRGELELHYQPQVEHATGRIVGMEALLRWNHPTRGMLRPAAFLPVAEKTGLIKPIGQWALDKACEQMSRWRQQGIAPMTLAVNVSSAQIKAGDEFVLFVTATLAKWGLSPGELELGVTESTLARATLSHNDVLQRFRNLGVKISIDDFGTKYSTLDYLRTYGVSRIRIPQVLLNAALKEPGSAAFVRAIVGIARELSIDVVAQGVETEDQWSLLSATPTVTKVQGYFFSEPVPASRAEQQLRQGHIGDRPLRRAAAAAG